MRRNRQLNLPANVHPSELFRVVIDLGDQTRCSSEAYETAEEAMRLARSWWSNGVKVPAGAIFHWYPPEQIQSIAVERYNPKLELSLPVEKRPRKKAQPEAETQQPVAP